MTRTAMAKRQAETWEETLLPSSTKTLPEVPATRLAPEQLRTYGAAVSSVRSLCDELDTIERDLISSSCASSAG